MDSRRTRRPSPALVVAVIALFVALGGTADAVISAAVPLAKRALVADKAKVATTAKTANVAKTATTAQNALKLNGSAASEIVASATAAGAAQALVASPPGSRPASTAAGLVQVKAAPVNLAAGEEKGFTISCNPLKVLGGGFSSNDTILALDSFPSTNGLEWSIYLVNLDDTNPASAVVRATCIS